MSETLKNKNVRIRKQRQCMSCLRVFPSGTKMNYWVGIVDGDFNSCYCCMTCIEIMNMRQDPDEEGFPEGYVHEMLKKGESPEQFIERLNHAAKAETGFCPECGIGLNNTEKQLKFCQNCKYSWLIF